VTTTFYDEAAFFDAWRAGAAIAGERFFGDGTYSPSTARSKWDLEPQVESISTNLGVLSSGEAMFLAAMVSFYDSRSGGEMLNQVGADGLSDIAARLDESRRQVLADLLVSYPGW
jgi:hypothetical protein